MKRFNDSVSSRALVIRSIVCCVLIISLCVSLSVGLGYSKFSIDTAGMSQTFSAKVLNLKANPDTITYALRNATGTTEITSSDNKVKVIVPENISCRLNDGTVINEVPSAFVLYSHKEASWYTPGADEYAIQYNVRLFALYDDEDKYGYAWSSAQDIILEIASDDVATSWNDHETPIHRGNVTYDDVEQCFRIQCKRLFKGQDIYIEYTTGTPATPNEPPQP